MVGSRRKEPEGALGRRRPADPLRRDTATGTLFPACRGGRRRASEGRGRSLCSGARSRPTPRSSWTPPASPSRDSAFLNLLVVTHRAGAFRLVSPSPQVRRICEITGLDTLLEIHPTVEDAALS
ncbi:STAS domain-containing protein [Streptomyces gulbargensis]|uniref:STAS domain-containing protein n=1 Tax=Streptomyces gulbargensis TaxID=364901 RepID=UPI0031E8FA22